MQTTSTQNQHNYKKNLIKKATKGGGGGGYFARITVWMLSNIQTTHAHTHAHISFAVYHAATIQIGHCKKASMWWVSSTVWIIHISLLLTVYLKLASNDKVVVSDEVRLQPNAAFSPIWCCINTQRDQLALGGLNTNTTTKTWVVYGNSHLAWQ